MTASSTVEHADSNEGVWNVGFVKSCFTLRLPRKAEARQLPDFLWCQT